MKIKVLILSGFICFAQLSQPLFADNYPDPYANYPTYPTYPNTYSAPETPSYNPSIYGNTHDVRPYYRKDGTFVRGHKAGNPGSGVHCHNNVCNYTGQ